MLTLADRAAAAIVDVHIRSNLTALAEALLTDENAPFGGPARRLDHLSRAVVPRPDYEEAARQYGWEVSDSGTQFINPKITGPATGQVRSWGNLTNGIATAIDWEMLCKVECLDAAALIRAKPDPVMEALAITKDLAIALSRFQETVIVDIPGLIVWSRIARRERLQDDHILKQIGHLAMTSGDPVFSGLVDVEAIRQAAKDAAALHQRNELDSGIIGHLRRARPILERLEQDTARWELATKNTGVATLNALRHIIDQAEGTVAAGKPVDDALLVKGYVEANRLHPIITDILGRNPELWDIARSTLETQDLSALLAKLHKVTAAQAA